METSAAPDPIQLHLVLPYKFEPADEPRVKALLDGGYRIAQMQRLSDQEVLITLTRRPL